MCHHTAVSRTSNTWFSWTGAANEHCNYVHRFQSFRWFLWMKFIKMDIQLFCVHWSDHSHISSPILLHGLAWDFDPMIFSPPLLACIVYAARVVDMYMIYIHNLKRFIKYGAFLYSLQASLSSVNLKLALYIQPSTLYNLHSIYRLLHSTACTLYTALCTVQLALYIQPSTLHNKSQHLKLYKSQTGSDVTV